MRRIGILGGTFNPIHIGHLMLAEWAMDAAALDEVWIIPTGISYLKSQQEILPGRERLHMTELAVKDNPRFRCLDMEIRREGYTYSYETLEELERRYPQNSFYFIVGADCLFSIETWKASERIFAGCTLIAAVRGETDLSKMEEKKRELMEKFPRNQDIILLPFISFSVSSTQIRERVRTGLSIRYLVPDKVMSYIYEKGFYSEKRNQFEKDQKKYEKDPGCGEI